MKFVSIILLSKAALAALTAVEQPPSINYCNTVFGKMCDLGSNFTSWLDATRFKFNLTCPGSATCEGLTKFQGDLLATSVTDSSDPALMDAAGLYCAVEHLQLGYSDEDKNTSLSSVLGPFHLARMIDERQLCSADLSSNRGHVTFGQLEPDSAGACPAGRSPAPPSLRLACAGQLYGQASGWPISSWQPAFRGCRAFMRAAEGLPAPNKQFYAHGVPLSSAALYSSADALCLRALSLLSPSTTSRFPDAGLVSLTLGDIARAVGDVASASLRYVAALRYYDASPLPWQRLGWDAFVAAVNLQSMLIGAAGGGEEAPEPVRQYLLASTSFRSRAQRSCPPRRVLPA